ncbi:MAG: MarR family winged helix-turn-helix transcriptional regulator [Sulfuriferula sp.]
MDRLRRFGFLLAEVSRRYVRRFEQRAQAISLTLPTCKVMTILERHESINQSKLAELANIEPMAMVRILDRMEADGTVERRPDPIDRRARSLYLTPKSKPTLDEIWRLAALTRAETFSGISQSERDVFLDVLERLESNLRQLADLPAEFLSEDHPGEAAPSPANAKHPSAKPTTE